MPTTFWSKLGKAVEVEDTTILHGKITQVDKINDRKLFESEEGLVEWLSYEQAPNDDVGARGILRHRKTVHNAMWVFEADRFSQNRYNGGPHN